MLAFKIWIISSILLTAYGVGGTQSEDDAICDEGWKRCRSEEPEPVQFPRSIEEMDKMCPAMTERLDCLLDYQNRCFSGEDQTLADVYAFTLEACDAGSELHRDFATHLPCIKSLTKNHYNVCQPLVDDAVDAVQTRVILGTEDTEEDMEYFRKLMCLQEAFSLACFTARAGVHCGADAKEFVGRILDRVGYLDVVCQADIQKEVKEMVEIIQLEMEENIALVEVFSKE